MGNRHYLAHRASYEEFIGPIQEGLHVLHRCDVRPCCNPTHLFIGTNQDNINDSVAKGRRKGIARNIPSGLTYKPWSYAARVSHMKLKPEHFAGVKSLLDKGETQRSVAKKYGVSQGTIFRIAHG